MHFNKEIKYFCKNYRKGSKRKEKKRKNKKKKGGSFNRRLTRRGHSIFHAGFCLFFFFNLSPKYMPVPRQPFPLNYLCFSLPASES